MGVAIPGRFSKLGVRAPHIPVDVRALDQGVMQQAPNRHQPERGLAQEGPTYTPGAAITPEQLDRLAIILADKVDRRVYFSATPINVGVAAVKIRPEEYRRYCFIQNTHNAQNLIVGFGYEPTALTGLVIGPQLGFYEPLWVPQNDIWVLGSGAATTGVILYATV